MTNITEEKLRHIIKEGVREALSGELMKLRALTLPVVSDREQADIEKRYKKPLRSIANHTNVNI